MLYNLLTIQEEVANAIGLKEAFVVMLVIEGCQYNQAKKECFHDGHWWAKLSYSGIANRYRFMGTEKGVQSMIRKLESSNILLSGVFNESKCDRTKWYRVNRDHLQKMMNEQK